MTQYIIDALPSLIIGGILTAIGFLIKHSVFEKLKEFGLKLDKYQESQNDDKLDLVRNYVTKNEMDKNIEAHEKIWIETNKIKQRLAKLEK